MASNYEAISEENKTRYGTDIVRIAPMLLADRYDDRTHFIFELLQNAEDALGRRKLWNGSRQVKFELRKNTLTLSHFGQPFNEDDVHGVCGIAQSTKDEFSIGRFGIGFKSVYTFTERPEIHSGSEDFAIENYVLPKKIDQNERDSNETQIILPLKSEDETAEKDITEGFKRLGASALLFLKHINEINWNVDGGISGVYLREKTEQLDTNVHIVSVIGQESGQQEVDQNWLVFQRDVFTSDQEKNGQVEIAFSLKSNTDEPGRWSVQPVIDSPLVVFFPTVVSTNLGFLLQGPYRTTPSRDNIPKGDKWNQYLVQETSSLLVEAMRWLRDKSMFNISALQCLPIKREHFPETSMFAPLFEIVRKSFMTEPLLPTFEGNYVAANKAKLARTQDVRELFNAKQISEIYDSDVSAWLSSEITPDRTPDVRHYIMQELGVAEITTPTLISRLSAKFLETQSDEWILSLYGFLSNQGNVISRLVNVIPFIRLTNGTHVIARENDTPNAFLPSDIETNYPTVHPKVCATKEARTFLLSLGVTEPDPVDDVIRNILPKYRLNQTTIDSTEYTSDIQRIIVAFRTDSKSQRDKLITSLNNTAFLRAVHTFDDTKCFTKAGSVYIATERLKQLFAGVRDVLIVDESYACLRGEEIRELLEACGSLRYPRPIPSSQHLTNEEKQQLRRDAGHKEISGNNEEIKDWTLVGLDRLLELLPLLPHDEQKKRAKALWESLGDLEERRGGIFNGTYNWLHYTSFKTDFPSAFVRKLNNVAWVPDLNGNLQPPNLVLFDTLEWKPNPFLQSKLIFKQPIIDQLAKEAGIDPAALDLLKTLGITSLADLTSRLGINEESTKPDIEPLKPDDVYGDARDLYGEDMPDMTTRIFNGNFNDDIDPNETNNRPANPNINAQPRNNYGGNGNPNLIKGNSEGEKNNRNGENYSSKQPGERTFISYISIHPNEEDISSDGLDQETRMQIEELAIRQITQLEPALHRTPPGNPGYDLFESDSNGKHIRWIEVKSMTGTLAERPVGLSSTQLNYAREKGDAYWLYVVERANDPEHTRILRIQNPYGNAKTFTLDHGWINIAQTSLPTREVK